MRFGPPTNVVAVYSGSPASSIGLEPRQQLAQERAQLHARQVRAEAEVHADAEREVVVGVRAPDVEAERVGEDRPRRGCAERYDSRSRSPCAMRRAAQDVVLLRVAHEVPDGRDPADHLVDRVVDQRRVALQRAELVGVADQRLEAAARASSTWCRVRPSRR